ncbi:MAG TPA: phosphatidate cytidylyltransferase [Anaerolineae bacterium]|jgi:phosphatidate cytidylyltransferase
MPTNAGETGVLPVQGARPRDSTLRTRFISGFFIGIVTIVTGVLGGFWFTGLVLLVILLSTYEVHGMLRSCSLRPTLSFSLAVAAVTFIAIRFPALPYLNFVAMLVLMASIAWQMRDRVSDPIANWSTTVAPAIYLGATGGYLTAVRELDQGLWWLIIAVGISWLADSAAYIIGRRFGKRKLAPSLSPKKTWEGFIGGVIFAVLGGMVAGIVSPLGFLNCTLAGLLVGILGTLGDLVESMFKRAAGVKDSGQLIPGHGGAFDRVDSLLWAGFAVYFFATIASH